MFNEATRVQMPALVHLTRLGYQYFGKIHEDDAKEGVYDPDTNILLKVFERNSANSTQRSPVLLNKLYLQFAKNSTTTI